MKVVRQKLYNPLEHFFCMITQIFNEKMPHWSQQISYAKHQQILPKISNKSQHLLITSSISDYSLSVSLADRLAVETSTTSDSICAWSMPEIVRSPDMCETWSACKMRSQYEPIIMRLDQRSQIINRANLAIISISKTHFPCAVANCVACRQF